VIDSVAAVAEAWPPGFPIGLMRVSDVFVVVKFFVDFVARVFWLI
jgi:hypothetical protein